MSARAKKSSPAAPLPFKITGSTQLEDWKKWQQSFRCYANSINLEQECHDVQMCVFKSLVGPDALEIYNTFSLLDVADVESVIRKFDEHFKPKVNVTWERYKLYKLNQKSGQSFDDFLSDINNQVDKCAFTAMRDEIILYKIVGGIDSDEVRNILLADADLKYDKAVEICRASSAKYSIPGKENFRKGTLKIKEEPVRSFNNKEGNTGKVSFKEQLELESTRSVEVVVSDGEMKPYRALLKLNDSAKVIEMGSAVEEFINENITTSKNAKVIYNSVEDDVEFSEPDSVERESLQNSDGASDEDDGDRRTDDDPDDYYYYDPEHRRLRKLNVVKERRKDIGGATRRKKRVSAVKSNVFLPCNICGKEFKTELSLERHRSTHMRGQHAVCYYCEKQYSKKHYLRKHMRKTHYEVIGCPPPKFYSCDECEFVTDVREVLQRHKYQHSGVKPLACELCEYRCIRPCLLRGHMASHHAGEKPFTCSICSRGFVYNDALKKHMLRHMSPEKRATYLKRNPCTCDICGKVFSSKGCLTTHLLLHTGEKPFACDKCDYRTVTKGSLKSHLMVHSDEKPWVCTVCGYSARQKSVLSQHILTHTGEKPHACELCGRRFTQSQHLKTHILTHTGEKPHVCEICGHGFTTRSSMRAHMKVHEKHSRGASHYTPPRKRLKKPVVVAAASSDECDWSGDYAVITWS